jgi:hypothetical protein
VIPLAMVVMDEFPEGSSRVALAEGHHPIEALVLDGPHEPLGVRVRIGRLKRRLHDEHPGVAQSCRTSRLHFRSRSQISTRWPLKKPSVAVSVRLTCRMNRPSDAVLTRESGRAVMRSRSRTRVVRHQSASRPDFRRKEVGPGHGTQRARRNSADGTPGSRSRSAI